MRDQPRPRIVGMVSTFREGYMAHAAVTSCQSLDGVLVFEGPVEGAEDNAGPESVFPSMFASNGGFIDTVTETLRLHNYTGSWVTDAAKRTAMLQKAKETWPGPLWGVWVDGDEILLNGDQLHDWIYRVEQQGELGNPVGGWPFPLVELDGTVAICMGKCVRLDLIRRYVVSSSLIELTNGDTRTVGNVEYWNPKAGALFDSWRARPPLQGEPHLQHRPILRDRSRTVERQHVAEARNYNGITLDAADEKG